MSRYQFTDGTILLRQRSTSTGIPSARQAHRDETTHRTSAQGTRATNERAWQRIDQPLDCAAWWPSWPRTGPPKSATVRHPEILPLLRLVPCEALNPPSTSRSSRPKPSIAFCGPILPYTDVAPTKKETRQSDGRAIQPRASWGDRHPAVERLAIPAGNGPIDQ